MAGILDARLAAIAATCVLGMGALAGCGSAKGQAKSSSAKTSATVSSSAKTKGARGATGALTRVGSTKETRKAGGTAAPSSRAGSARVKAAEQKGAAALHRAMVVYVACLRSHGVHAPANAVGSGPVPSLKGVNTSSPQFKAASARCEATARLALRRG